jgi:Tfp pilus assembly protein FimT
MAPIALLAIAAATAFPQSSGATLSVGATVVRPDLAPQVTVGHGRAVVSNVTNVAVSAEGGTVRRGRNGTLLVTPAGPGPVRIVFTY